MEVIPKYGKQKGPLPALFKLLCCRFRTSFLGNRLSHPTPLQCE